ncbi:uncharacterized protein [Eleutherodactylus coqui]|uniref:uncharacterized protein isoform X2 n=1 Tax=Eleutherodactylus coqui TaxID=57060 RepID=UPI003461AC3E
MGSFFCHVDGSSLSRFQFGAHCNMTGVWVNTLGSVLNISAEGSQIRGSLHSSVELHPGAVCEQMPGELVGLVGQGDQPTFTMSTSWKGGSVTAWVGQCFQISGCPVLKTIWLLRSKATIEDNWKATRFCTAEIACSFQFLHRCVNIHRDIKLGNIMLDGDGHICLIDLGLAKDGVTPSMKISRMTGTYQFMAPEVLHEKEYDAAVDWWSLGIVVSWMAAGPSPFYYGSSRRVYQIHHRKGAKVFLLAGCWREASSEEAAAKES